MHSCYRTSRSPSSKAQQVWITDDVTVIGGGYWYGHPTLWNLACFDFCYEVKLGVYLGFKMFKEQQRKNNTTEAMYIVFVKARCVSSSKKKHTQQFIYARRVSATVDPGFAFSNSEIWIFATLEGFCGVLSFDPFFEWC